MRIHVVGTSGSGKSTIARELARTLQIPHIELDELHWGASWTPKPSFFEDTVASLDRHPHWVVCGNYSKVADEITKRVDTIVWLDFPIWTPLLRITLRSIKRSLLREKLWAGNQETFTGFLFSKESMFRWVLRTHARRKTTYSALRDETSPRVNWIALQKPEATETLIAKIKAQLNTH